MTRNVAYENSLSHAQPLKPKRCPIPAGSLRLLQINGLSCPRRASTAMGSVAATQLLLSTSLLEITCIGRRDFGGAKYDIQKQPTTQCLFGVSFLSTRRRFDGSHVALCACFACERRTINGTVLSSMACRTSSAVSHRECVTNASPVSFCHTDCPLTRAFVVSQQRV